METARTVKDVSPHEFVKAYAAHLKRSGKVSLSSLSLINICTWCVYMYIYLFSYYSLWDRWFVVWCSYICVYLLLISGVV